MNAKKARVLMMNGTSFVIQYIILSNFGGAVQLSARALCCDSISCRCPEGIEIPPGRAV